MPVHQKKRKFEMARQPSMTKLGAKQVRSVRGRGGNFKHRALRVDVGNYTWASEAFSSKTRILDVVYNATNNELVRTKTLVKNCIVKVDATPFRQWYLKHYDVELNKKKAGESAKV
jgi:small subunit ribosomal protein S8e